MNIVIRSPQRLPFGWTERDREEFSVDSSMTRNADEHPEQSYRRGFQQGAIAVFEGIEGKLDFQTRKRLQRFIYRTLTAWRWQRHLGRHIHKNRPPALKLKGGSRWVS